MSDEIKQIAALIGHQQAQEKRVAALIDEFQKESAQLSWQTAQLSQVIRELDSASGNMTEMVKKSVNTALNQVERELKQAGIEQQKPAVNALNQVVKAANDSVNALRSEMLQYRWKSIAYIAIAMIAVMGGCLWGMYYFIDSGYARIAEMQRMEAVWEQKAPLANIITCDDKPCVMVTGDKYTNKRGDVFYKIKQGK